MCLGTVASLHRTKARSRGEVEGIKGTLFGLSSINIGESWNLNDRKAWLSTWALQLEGGFLCVFSTLPPNSGWIWKTLKLNKPKPSLDISGLIVLKFSSLISQDFWGISTGVYNLVKGSFKFRLFILSYDSGRIVFFTTGSFGDWGLPGKFKSSERRGLTWVQTFGADLYKLAAVENKPNKQNLETQP